MHMIFVSVCTFVWRAIGWAEVSAAQQGLGTFGSKVAGAQCGSIHPASYLHIPPYVGAENQSSYLGDCVLAGWRHLCSLARSRQHSVPLHLSEPRTFKQMRVLCGSTQLHPTPPLPSQVAFIQMLKASTPVFVLVLSFLLRIEKPSVALCSFPLAHS